MNSEKYLYFLNLLVSRLINAGKSARALQPKKILCIKLDEIGDMATALHVFPLLKQRFPSAEITVLCKPFAGSLLMNNPCVDQVIFDIKEWTTSFDLLVELRGNWKTLLRSLHYKYWPGYRLDRGWVRFKQRGKQPHEAVTNFRIIEPVLAGDWDAENISAWYQPLQDQGLLFPSSEDLGAAELWLSQAERQAMSVKGELPAGIAIIHAGARKALRQWPLENFALLSDWLWKEKRFWPIWVGTEEEQSSLMTAYKPELGSLWISGKTEPKNTSLLAFYALISKSKLFIGNESGPLQLAALSKVSLLGLFGPGVEQVFYPIGARPFVFSDTSANGALGGLKWVGALNSSTERDAGGVNNEEGKEDSLINRAILHCLLPCNPCDQLNCIHPSNTCMQRIGVFQAIELLQQFRFT